MTRENKVVSGKTIPSPHSIASLETRGGFVDEGEAFDVAMKRELLEETGYEFDNVGYLGKFAANPGVLNNYTEMFFASGGEKDRGAGTGCKRRDRNSGITDRGTR